MRKGIKRNWHWASCYHFQHNCGSYFNDMHSSIFTYLWWNWIKITSSFFRFNRYLFVWPNFWLLNSCAKLSKGASEAIKCDQTLGCLCFTVISILSLPSLGLFQFVSEILMAVATSNNATANVQAFGGFIAAINFICATLAVMAFLCIFLFVYHQLKTNYNSSNDYISSSMLFVLPNYSFFVYLYINCIQVRQYKHNMHACAQPLFNNLFIKFTGISSSALWSNNNYN